VSIYSKLCQDTGIVQRQKPQGGLFPAPAELTTGSPGLGMVLHACNPSYAEGEDGRTSVQDQAKISENPNSTYGLCVVTHVCDPGYLGGGGGRIMV
jgi:hypothetical protein